MEPRVVVQPESPDCRPARKPKIAVQNLLLSGTAASNPNRVRRLTSPFRTNLDGPGIDLQRQASSPSTQPSQLVAGPGGPSIIEAIPLIGRQSEGRRPPVVCRFGGGVSGCGEDPFGGEDPFYGAVEKKISHNGRAAKKKKIP